MLAQRVQLDVAHHDHVVVRFGEYAFADDGLRRLAVAPGQPRERARDSRWSSLQSFAFRILAKQFQLTPNRCLELRLLDVVRSSTVSIRRDRRGLYRLHGNSISTTRRAPGDVLRLADRPASRRRSGAPHPDDSTSPPRASLDYLRSLGRRRCVSRIDRHLSNIVTSASTAYVDFPSGRFLPCNVQPHLSRRPRLPSCC